MRFNPQETTGSIVRLRYTVDLEYEVQGSSDFVLNVHAARTPQQTVVEESCSLDPFNEVAVDQDSIIANRLCTFAAGPGTLRFRYAALVDITHHLADPATLVAETPASLPPDAIRFLYSSRYCQSDLVQQEAWDRFGSLPRGYAQVVAVRNWVRSNVRFQIGASSPTTTVADTLRDGAGVCRDFAHTMIALCRGLNYPARYSTGVDYGADPALGPTDFHAYVEVFLAGRWYLFDPTGISPVTGLVRIGTGRDAAEVSFATIFGPVRTGMPRVSISAIEDAAQGFLLPVSTDLAVSTAE
ncbi:MAG: transglutaminase family protein [Betaproteobacteria bacterium]